MFWVTVGVGLLLITAIATRVLQCISDNAIAKKIKAYQPSPHQWSGTRFLVIVNPYGGTGRGKYVHEHMLVPMFHKANITFDAITTTGAGQFYETGRTFDENKYGAVVVMSGD